MKKDQVNEDKELAGVSAESERQLTGQPPIRQCFSCAVCELSVFRDCPDGCNAGFCQSHYITHMQEAHGHKMTITLGSSPPSEFEQMKAQKAQIHSKEAECEKWKRRALAFQQGYRDKAFEVTALEIQLLDCRAYGADKVTARNNESLRAKLLAACIERNEAKLVAKAAQTFVWEPENWENYQNCKGTNSAALPPEWFELCATVEEEFGAPPLADGQVTNTLAASGTTDQDSVKG